MEMVVMGFHKSSGIKPGKCFPSAYQETCTRTQNLLFILTTWLSPGESFVDQCSLTYNQLTHVNPPPRLFRADLGLHCACSKPGNICLDWAGGRGCQTTLPVLTSSVTRFRHPGPQAGNPGSVPGPVWAPGLMCSCALPPATSLGLSLPISNI